jgi:hypothetical protein
MRSLRDLNSEDLTHGLGYAGFVLLGFELVKSMIVGPIKFFYAGVTFGPGMPFKSYDDDVRSRDRNEFQACLLYLRDFMGAIDDQDIATIQDLREHRNELAHDLVARLPLLRIDPSLWERVDRVLFKLSNYRTRMEIGADPQFQDVEWGSVKGHEYLLFEHIVERVRAMNEALRRGQ